MQVQGLSQGTASPFWSCDQFPTLYPWLFLLRMTLMMSRHVVFLLTPEIHLVTSSTITGTSTAASRVSLLPDNCWLELDNWLECLITDDECFPSSFLDSDLLRESLGGFGSVLCLVRWWYALLLSTSMITFILITECHLSYDDLMITCHYDADIMTLIVTSLIGLIRSRRGWDHDLSCLAPGGNWAPGESWAESRWSESIGVWPGAVALAQSELESTHGACYMREIQSLWILYLLLVLSYHNSQGRWTRPYKYVS